MQDKDSPLNLALKYAMQGCLKFAYRTLNCTKPDALNLTTQNQTKACITKSSWEICTLLDIMKQRIVILY